MISTIIYFLATWQLPLNFLIHGTIFVGALYTAIHNRDLPDWVVTPLWYVGLTNLFTLITIVCQWSLGPEFYLSYWNIGALSETLSRLSIALIMFVLLVKTLQCDISNRCNRKK